MPCVFKIWWEKCFDGPGKVLEKFWNYLSVKCCNLGIKKVKGLDIYIPPLTGNPDQQRFTIEVAY